MEEIEKEYAKLISHLKILGIRANYNKQLEEGKEYRRIAKRLEEIREKRHLDMVGKKGEATKKYQEMAKEIIKIYDGTDESAKNTFQFLKETEFRSQEEDTEEQDGRALPKSRNVEEGR